MSKILNLKLYRCTGFYISLVSVITLLAAVISYTTGFTGVLLEYNSSNVIVISLIGIVAFFVLLVFEPTASYAPLALWAASFVSLLQYVSNIYMYFTGIFYNGISAEAFKLIDPAVLTSTILFAVSLIAGNIAMYMKHSARKEA